MTWLWILLGVLAFLLIGFLAITYICYRITFYAPKRKPLQEDEFDIPEGEIYEPWRESMVKWTKEVRAMPAQEFSIKGLDFEGMRAQILRAIGAKPDCHEELSAYKRSKAGRNMNRIGG